MAVAFLSGLVNLAEALIYFGERGWLILYRDLVSATISSILITVFIAWLIRFFSKRGTGALKFVLISGGATVVLVHVFMLISLVVHCTSGDCL